MFRREKRVPADTTKVACAREFAECACTSARIEQGVDELFTKTHSVQKKDMDALIKWMQNDIVTEELDTLQANGLSSVDVGKPIASVVWKWFVQYKTHNANTV